MKITYIQLKDEKKEKGCALARVFVRYPEIYGCENINEFFKSEAQAFFKFITESAFTEKGLAFTEYTERGGRRSLFPVTDYALKITAAEETEKHLTVKTEASVSEDGGLLKSTVKNEVFEVKTGFLCRKRKKRASPPAPSGEGYVFK